MYVNAYIIALGLSSTHVSPKTDPSVLTQQLDPSLRALELHEKGQRCYENSDLRCAIKLWTLAYEELTGNHQLISQQTTLVFLITSAQIEAFIIDSQAQHLQIAKILLTKHLGLLAPSDKANQQAIAERLQIIETNLAQTKSITSSPLPSSKASKVQPNRQIVAKNLTISGSVLAGVGLGLVGFMGLGIHLGLDADRKINQTTFPMAEAEKAQIRRWIQQGTKANQLAYGAGISGGIFVVSGLAMMITARVYKHKRWLAMPTFSPPFSGIHVGGRF